MNISFVQGRPEILKVYRGCILAQDLKITVKVQNKCVTWSGPSSQSSSLYHALV